jgi:hypothetical protein
MFVVSIGIGFLFEPVILHRVGSPIDIPSLKLSFSSVFFSIICVNNQGFNLMAILDNVVVFFLLINYWRILPKKSSGYLVCTFDRKVMLDIIT